MSIRKGLIASVGRTVVLTTVAALILTTSETPLTAAPGSRASHGHLDDHAAGNATDFSSRHRYRHYRGGAAAGAAFMGLAIGAIVGAVAAQQRRDEYYYSEYPGYSDPGYYYAPGNDYGRSYYYNRPHYYHQHYYRPF